MDSKNRTVIWKMQKNARELKNASAGDLRKMSLLAGGPFRG